MHRHSSCFIITLLYLSTIINQLYYTKESFTIFVNVLEKGNIIKDFPIISVEIYSASYFGYFRVLWAVRWECEFVFVHIKNRFLMIHHRSHRGQVFKWAHWFLFDSLPLFSILPLLARHWSPSVSLSFCQILYISLSIISASPACFSWRWLTLSFSVVAIYISWLRSFECYS